MKTMFRALPLPVIVAACGLVSCATVSKVGKGSVAFVQKTSAATASKVTEISDKIRPAQVKVVEVREKDLRPLPTGREQALAYENTRKRSFWSFMGGPVDFVEPDLPAPGVGEEDVEILLPPKAP
jgi:hypothetical protein